MLELRVPVRVLLALDGFLRSLKAVAKLWSSLPTVLSLTRMPCSTNSSRDNGHGALRAPAQTGFGIPPRRWVDEPLQRRQQLRMNIDVIPVASAAAANVREVIDLRAATQLVAPTRDGVERESRRARDHRKAAAPNPAPAHNRVMRSSIEPLRASNFVRMSASDVT